MKIKTGIDTNVFKYYTLTNRPNKNIVKSAELSSILAGPIDTGLLIIDRIQY